MKQNLADAEFEFLRYVKVLNEKLPAEHDVFPPTKVLLPSFYFPHTCLPFVEIDILGVIEVLHIAIELLP